MTRSRSASLRERQRDREARVLGRLAAAEAPPLLTRIAVAQIVRAAEAEGIELVELVVPRTTPPTRRSGFTVKLLGRCGPRSDADGTPRQVGPRAWSARWRVADLRLLLDAPPPAVRALDGWGGEPLREDPDDR